MKLLDLFIKISADDKASGQLDGITQKAISKAEKIAGMAGKTTGAIVGAATTAVSVIGKMSFSAYSDYEQLVGGVDTLFKDASDRVQQYAAMAYQTTGQSANQYMEQVTGFSASLLQSLGQDTVAAAEYGNMAMIDMADNANKMGTSMESIQYAYQGFAKQNFTIKLMSAA